MSKCRSESFIEKPSPKRSSIVQNMMRKMTIGDFRKKQYEFKMLKEVVQLGEGKSFGELALMN
jgi:hypothetical protein